MYFARFVERHGRQLFRSSADIKEYLPEKKFERSTTTPTQGLTEKESKIEAN
jgi:hypothetical protein